MKQRINSTSWVMGLFIIMMGSGCTTDPVIPTGGIPVTPPVEDPGPANQCAEGIISFQHQVLPILVSACAYSGCHDAATAEEDVVLDTYINVLKSVVPGKPERSELYEYIVDGGDDIMPPPPAPRLTDAQIGLIRDWIEQGAENTDCGAPCDSTQTSFKTSIYPLLQDYCVGCHSSSRADGNVILESHQDILPYVESGALLGSMRHDPYFAIMPPTGSKLSECKLDQVRKWIEEGASNN